MSKEPVKLTDQDWEDLFPGEPFKLGKTEITIIPLDLESLAVVLKKVRSLADILQKRGVTLMNFNNPFQIPVLVENFLTEAPEAFEAMTGVHQDDLKRLPIGTAIELFTVALSVNSKSHKSLVKNLKALAGEITQMTNGVSEIQSSSSSKAVTRGKK